MAGTAYPGATDPTNLGAGSDTSFLLAGMTRGTIPFSQWTEGDGGRPQIEPLEGDQDVGAITSDTQGSDVTKVDTAHAGIHSEASGAGLDWFNDLHIVPRGKINFGNIITQEEEDFEIFNAYHRTTITISSYDDSEVTPGINLEGFTVPATVYPNAGLVDPSSTPNNSGTGLGTVVAMAVQALTTGLPLFDGTITFAASSSETVSLSMEGQRLIFVPFEYESPTEETLAFLTDIIEALDGNEQRIALRKTPRQTFQIRYLLSENDRQRMQVLLMGWMPNQFGFPLWHEQERLTVAASVGTTVYTIQDTSGMDLRVGGLAVVYTDANTFDVINISAITSTTIVADDPSVYSYPVGTKIMPLRLAYLQRAVSGRRYANNLEEFICTWEVTDNATGALTGDTTPGVWSTFVYPPGTTRVLFDDCNVIEQATMAERYEQRIHRIDNQTGRISQSSTWDISKRSATKGIVLHNRAEIIKFRRLLQSLQGRVVSFWMPTFIDDITAVEQLSSGSSTMVIENIEYLRFVELRLPKILIRVTTTSGTTYDREITNVAAHVDEDKETLTVDTTWPTTITVAEIDRIEFFELVRFDTDNFRLRYPHIGRAYLTAPVKQVFDEN